MRVADDHRPVELTADILEPAAQHNFAAAPNGAEGGFHLGSRAGTSPDIAAAPRGDDLADEDSADPHPAPDRGEAASLRIGVAAIDGTMVARRDEPAHAVDALAATALLDRPFTSAGTDFSGWSGDHPVPASDDDSAVGETWRNGTPGAGKDTAAILPADEVEHYSGLGETWLHAMPSALYEMKMPRVWNAPSQMNLAARLMLFTVIYGRAVTRYVEIGTARGGSALIVSQAFELLKKQGLKPRGACIDRSFADVSSENRQELQKSFTLIERPANLLSAKVAHKSVRGHFDCALVDGGRETDQVVSDALALMPFMAPGAYMLFHWAAYAAVAKALDYLEANTSLQPCGALSLHAHLAGEGKLRGPDHTGGLYLMRVTDRHEPVPVSKIRKKAAAAGRTSSAKK
jgi:predicted O-methyltransferase YrrM